MPSVRLLLLHRKDDAVILETARTIVRGWREADLPVYAHIVADPDVMRFVGEGSVQTAAQATAFVHAMRQHARERGWTCWAVEATATGTLMGWCGFGLRERQVNFAYRFATAFWGQGFGTEVTHAVLAYGVAQYHLVPCTAVAFVENTASIRLLEKLGFRVERYGGPDDKRVAYYTYVPC
jgi:RimJ/RimL family protein N-acetyltransferase